MEKAADAADESADEAQADEAQEAEDELTEDVAGSEDADADAGAEAEALEEVAFEEIVVVDNDYLSITVTGIDPDSSRYYLVDVTIVNKSADVTYMVATTDACAVDGVQCDTIFATEVAAGKTAYAQVKIYNIDELEEVGVAFTDILLTFRAYDSDDWSADEVVEAASVHIYPYGEENAVAFERESLDTDIVLVDNEYVTVTVIGYGAVDGDEYALELYVVNKTDAEIMVATDDESVNGIMCSPYWAASVSAGLVSYETLDWSSSRLESIGITDPANEVYEVEFTLRVYNSDDWSVDDYVEDLVITLSL